jgi:acetyl-CoA carboxylase biotin carboxylase subunit
MKKLLVANRGEIAVRIIRTAKKLGIKTVLTVSEGDKGSLAARVADEVEIIGPAPAGASYLNIEAVISALTRSEADAVHPGFGFLAENADFAQSVMDAGAIWVGPRPETIALMGNKSAAREVARNAGVPTLPGTDGPLADDVDINWIGAEVGFPLVVKASSGGGGKGIRRVDRIEDLQSTIEVAQAEARAAFGDDKVYLERFIENARHVEVQVLADGKSAIHLGDRDCSMQRRHQKVLEEAPAPSLPDSVRNVIRESSVSLAEECGYEGAGTVEFLYDPVREEASFIEMNTRLQVEHPVTEMVTGRDIVEDQLRIAQGEVLSIEQSEIRFRGHAIEARINAEDPHNNFFPSPGQLTSLVWPEGAGIRVDAGFEQGGEITPYYDSMIAKLIVSAPTRDEAIERMKEALRNTEVSGVASTIPLLSVLVESEEFSTVRHDTAFIENSALLQEGK